MWMIKDIFGKTAPLAARIVGAIALGLLLVGCFNIYTTGVPTIPLLIYRGVVVVVGVALLFLALRLGQRSE